MSRKNFFLLSVGAVLFILAVGQPTLGRAAEARQRVSVGYRAGLNISVDFSTAGGIPTIVTPQGVTVEGDEWNYINGYALVGSSGSATETPYWGHQALDASKLPSTVSVIDLPNDASLVNLYRYDAAQTDLSDDVLEQGGEVTFSRLFGELGSGHWGFQGAFAFGRISSRADFSTPIFLRTDQYSIPGSPIPSLGYEGSREGTVPPFATEPLILLDPVGTHQTSIDEAIWSAKRAFEADIYEIKLGPYAELPLSRRFSVNLSGGVTVAALQSELRVDPSVRVSDLAVVDPARRGSVSGDEFLFGGYLGGQLWYSLTYRWSLYAGVQYQYLESTSLRVGGTTARLDLGQSIFASAGVGFAF